MRQKTPTPTRLSRSARLTKKDASLCADAPTANPAADLDGLREELLARGVETGELREQVKLLQRELAAREERLYDTLAEIESAAWRDERDPKRREYYGLISRVREIVRERLPREARILVISKGDAAITRLYGRQGLHFPQNAAGHGAGHYLSDLGALAHLEALRAQGADYLLIPATALWWLDHYPQFRRHLESQYALVFRQDETCAIFALRQPPEEGAAIAWSRLDHAIAEHEEMWGCQASILNWDTGLSLAARFPSESVFEPPCDLTVLPYLDGSVDMVAIMEPDAKRLKEARRVAASAVLIFGRKNGEEDVALSIEWQEKKGKRALPRAEIIFMASEPVTGLKERLMELHAGLPTDFTPTFRLLIPKRQAAKAPQDLLPEWLKVVETDTPIARCNQLARTSKAEILAFIDCGLLLLPECLPTLASTFRDFPDAGVAGGRLLYPDGRLNEIGRVPRTDGTLAPLGDGEWAGDAPEFSYVREIEICSSGLMATRRSVFVEIGGFDPEFSQAAYATADYSLKVRAAGHRIYCQPDSLAVTPVSVTPTDDAGDASRRLFADHWQSFLSVSK